MNVALTGNLSVNCDTFQYWGMWVLRLLEASGCELCFGRVFRDFTCVAVTAVYREEGIGFQRRSFSLKIL